VAGAGQPPVVKVLLAVLLAGVLTHLPALGTPFLLDDYLHISMLEGTFPVERGPFDLYDFVNDTDRPVLLARGILPWWSSPKLKIRFFRPLSSALMWADHGVFGNRPLALHLHSLVWWAAAVVAARTLFRRTLSPRVTGIASLIFAVAPCHAIPLAWLANREALVSLALGTFALIAYVRWREERSLRQAALASILFALAMLGGEYALCFGGYVLAIELVTRGEAFARRVSGVLPFAVPTALYLAARGALDYGTAGSGFYSDPFRDPLAFAMHAPVRLAALLGGGWLTIDTIGWGATPPAWVALIVVVVFGVAFVPLRRMFARLDGASRKAASWLLIGSVISLVPVLAVVPSSRLLGVSYLGIAAVIALFLDYAWFPAVPQKRSGVAELTGLVALAFGYAQLVQGPVTAWLTGAQLRRGSIEFASRTAWVRSQLPDRETANVVVIRGMADMFFGPFALDVRGAQPARWRTLAHTGHTLVLRKDPRTIELVLRSDRGLYPFENNLFRANDAPLPAGAEVILPGMRAKVIAVGAEGPFDVTFEFDRDLDSATFVWLVENFDGFRAAELPKTGFGIPLDP
jgi:hypothetical protein